MNTLPTYSAEALDALDLFFADCVEALFYFEDEAHEAVYERLLQRLIPNIKKFKVICLGGKSKLLTKAEENFKDSVKRIFIADKDYDDLLGKIAQRRSFYYIRRFSIENYLADLLAIVKVAVEESPRKHTVNNAVAKITDARSVERRFYAALTKVARLFVVAQRYQVGIQTTKLSSEDLLGKDPPSIDSILNDTWYQNYLTKFIGALHGANEWLSDQTARQIQLDGAFDQHPNTIFPALPAEAHVCGKHLLACLKHWIGERLEVDLMRLDPIEFYVRLMNHIEIAPLAYLSEAILNDHPDLTSPQHTPPGTLEEARVAA